MLDGMLARLLPKTLRLASTDELAQFLDSRAAFLAQKCVVEFSRVRAGVHWQKLFSEREFQEALTRSCWLSYTPALAMLAEMVEAQLRPVAGDRARAVRDGLAQLVARVRAEKALPGVVPAADWAAQAQLVAERLGAAELAPPRPVRQMARPMARRVFEALPLHVDIVAKDYDYIENNLRVNLVRAHEEFVDGADPERLADALGGA